MIRIHRPNTVPTILVELGALHVSEMVDALRRDSEAYKSFKFRGSIYGHPSVKASLFAAQQAKCAFCEQILSKYCYGDVEHFRPKGQAQQAAGEPFVKPGYYWLAYEWSNLLVACDDCNSKHKKSFFPLACPTDRACGPSDDLTKEQPLLVDPMREEPADFIRFNRHVAVAPDDNSRGTITRQVLGLNREPLKRRREEWLEKLKLLKATAEASFSESISHRAKALLPRCATAEAEFSAMARDYLASVVL